MKIYLCRGMSGRNKRIVVKEALRDRAMLRSYGITPLCPVEYEAVENKNETLLATKKQMDTYWKRDKELIREANVVFDMTPGLKSFGCEHEIGYARYFLWKPVIRVFKKGKMPSPGNVSFYEDDFITDSLEKAIRYAKDAHGTLFNRFNWRINMYRKSLFKAIIHKISEWK